MRKLIMVSMVLALTAACGDFTYGRDLEGEVVNTGSRFKAGDNGGGQTKISLVVKATKSDPTIDEVAGGPSGVVIECRQKRGKVRD